MIFLQEEPVEQRVISPLPVTVDGKQFLRRFSLQEFAQVCSIFLDDCLELINGDIVISPAPDTTHIQQTIHLESLLRQNYTAIHAKGCQIAGASAWYSVPKRTASQWTERRENVAACVRPDISICYAKYWERKQLPPAVLVIEVLAVTSQREIDRDLISKPDIYASLDIPTYWVIDRRDESVWVHTAPSDGKYTKRVQYKGRKKLPAPGLEFLTITPAQIFAA